MGQPNSHQQTAGRIGINHSSASDTTTRLEELLELDELVEPPELELEDDEPPELDDERELELDDPDEELEDEEELEDPDDDEEAHMLGPPARTPTPLSTGACRR